ncbi:MAG: T9SS type A sorting domain-containing protein [Sporocytophaga sp.]|uniref:T9SS type A sorting domain-containing protein n=1 Tax=Sporocytophaga sp. TaxID=2231183 RepID=UPI001B2CCEF1|nr:T9SS type A sorting domain-containing protein [Sporocytophaga sp.]MBO9699779.1 T9SS type A sorting domain-containing protein [Sporocytophaga sp.]
MSNGKVFVRFFADFSGNNEAYNLRFDERSPLNNAFLDNGTLILKYTTATSTESIYFSLTKDELKFEETRSSSLYSFLYKKTEGQKLYHYIEFDQTKSMPVSVVVINDDDTIHITLPNPLQNLNGIAGDSNYIWLRSTTGKDSIFTIWRMRRDQNIIKGIIYYDTNKNGIQDAYEFGVSKYPLKIYPSGITVFPDRNGNFSFAGSVGERYTMEIPAQSEFDYISTTLPYTFQNSGENKIGITVANPISEICTNFFTPWPRCETIGTGSIRVENTGFKGIELIRLTLIGDPLTEINSLDAISKKSDALIFQISELLPLDLKLIPFEIHFPGGDKVGEILNFKLITEIYSNESVVSTTYDNINSIVRCSFDPNDKSVTPAGVGEDHLTENNSPLSYMIRFENTGNDTAYTVIVYDTLDLNLNLSTFKVLGSSHPVITEISKEGVVTFHFEKIMLPDSKTDKEKGHGFIRFSVEPKKELKEGDIIKNSAGIVFDKNSPILTNTVFNTFTVPVVASVQEKFEKEQFLYPNPAKDIVYFRTDKESEVYVYDFTGKMILQNKCTSITTADWNEGLYIFKVVNSKGEIQGIEKVLITK